MNKWLIILFFLVAVLAGLFTWGKYAQQQKLRAKIKNPSDLISADDLHWHPIIKIFVKGEEQLIPANIGIGAAYAGDPQFNPVMGMTEIHTHDDSGKIHLEMAGPVTKDEIKLGNFFRIWGQKFPGVVRVTVNGQEIKDFENYQMKDNDQIEINYE